MPFIDVPPLPTFARGVLPAFVEPHVVPAIGTSAVIIGAYLLVAIVSYFTTWPNVLLSHPKYHPQSRTYPQSQLELELRHSIRTALIVSRLAYPLFVRVNAILVDQPLDTVTLEEVGKLALALWLSYDFGGYIVHRLFHSNSFLYEWVHESAHKFLSESSGTFHCDNRRKR
jgi:sterol desaturase/sphingolipid hydroxylase (fatty acid hydroxylase superfamily)